MTARLIEAPIRPESAAWPRPKLLLAIGAVLGLIAGFIAALVSLRQEESEREEAHEAWGPPARAAGRAGIDVR